VLAARSVESVKNCVCKFWERSEHFPKTRACGHVALLCDCALAISLSSYRVGECVYKLWKQIKHFQKRSRSGILHTHVRGHPVRGHPAHSQILFLHWIVSGSVCVCVSNLGSI
jgi:hypothetical protein